LGSGANQEDAKNLYTLQNSVLEWIAITLKKKTGWNFAVALYACFFILSLVCAFLKPHPWNKVTFWSKRLLVFKIK
jgi:hypothetical protein